MKEEKSEYGIPEKDRPYVKLVGEDGNAFAIIGRVSQALKSAGFRGKATEMSERALSSSSYNEVLVIVLEYVMTKRMKLE